MEKPEKLIEEHLLYLDSLRESGVTNMYGAVPYLEREYPELSDNDAKKILLYWMETFGIRHK